MQPLDTAKSLSDTQYDQLSDLLEKRRSAMNLEAINGFFAALHCVPDLVMPSQYLGDILGDQTDDNDAFENEDQAQEFFSLLMQHWNHVGSQLRGEDVYLPFLLEDDKGITLGNDWAKGFLQGMEHNKDDWQILLDDEEQGGAMVPIFALAHEHDPDPELRPYVEPVTDERRENLLVGIAAGATMIYRYFETHRHFSAHEKTHAGTYRREAPKVGRNMPCPCGSGKKYKKCCGKATLH